MCPPFELTLRVQFYFAERLKPSPCLKSCCCSVVWVLRQPPSLSWLPDGAAHPDGYPAVPAAAEDASAGPKQTLVTLESPQQQQQQVTGAGELPSELAGQSNAQGSGQLLMPVEQEDSGPGRPSTDAEATQMELSPAPTISKWPQASPCSRCYPLFGCVSLVRA